MILELDGDDFLLPLLLVLLRSSWHVPHSSDGVPDCFRELTLLAGEGEADGSLAGLVDVVVTLLLVLLVVLLLLSPFLRVGVAVELAAMTLLTRQSLHGVGNNELVLVSHGAEVGAEGFLKLRIF